MQFDWNIFWNALTSSDFVHGALITIALTVLAQITAALLGLLLALAANSSSRSLRGMAKTYVWFFRAIPALLQLLFIWNALPQLVPGLRQAWFTPFLAGYIGLSLAESAYMAEIIRAALLAVSPGQRLAARALGMTPWTTLRRITIPQVARIAIPPTANEFITLLKLTSLTSVISLRELLTITQQQVAATFRFAELYAAATVYYLVIVSVLMIGQGHLERRYRWTSKQRSARRLPGRRARPAEAEVELAPETSRSR